MKQIVCGTVWFFNTQSSCVFNFIFLQEPNNNGASNASVAAEKAFEDELEMLRKRKYFLDNKVASNGGFNQHQPQQHPQQPQHHHQQLPHLFPAALKPLHPSLFSPPPHRYTDSKKILELLLHKPYWHRATLSKDYILWSPNRYEMDLSNVVLKINFGKEAAKIQEFKVGGQKNICRSAQFKPMHPGLAELADIFFNLQLWYLCSPLITINV